jgi:hypothetical protein
MALIKMRQFVKYMRCSNTTSLILAILIASFVSGCACDRGKPPMTQLDNCLSRSAVYVSENIPYMICFPKEYAANVRAAKLRDKERESEKSQNSNAPSQPPMGIQGGG